jgi:hypothetical protein
MGGGIVLNEKLGKELGLRMLVIFVHFYLPSFLTQMARRSLCNPVLCHQEEYGKQQGATATRMEAETRGSRSS